NTISKSFKASSRKRSLSCASKVHTHTAIKTILETQNAAERVGTGHATTSTTIRSNTISTIWTSIIFIMGTRRIISITTNASITSSTTITTTTTATTTTTTTTTSNTRTISITTIAATIKKGITNNNSCIQT